MYGYKAYIREDNGIFYLDRDFMETPPSSLMSFYNRNLIVTTSESLAELVSKVNVSETCSLLAALESSSFDDLNRGLWELSPESHIKCWEEAYIELFKNGNNLSTEVREKLEYIVSMHRYLYLEINVHILINIVYCIIYCLYYLS